MKTIVLGIGNDLLRDDGIGVKLANDLKIVLPEKEGMCFKTSINAGLDIINLIKDFDRLIVIDGIKCCFHKPGTVQCYSITDYPSTLHLNSFHDSRFDDIITLSGKLNLKTPEEIRIITIEIADDLTFDAELSFELKSTYEKILKKCRIIIERILENTKNGCVYEAIQ